MKEKQTRSNLKAMLRLAALAKPLAGTMALAVLLGVLGHLCAIFIPLLGAVCMGQLVQPGGLPLGRCLAALPVLAVLRGVLHYGEQNRNHDLAFRLLALIRSRVFESLRRLAPAKMENRDKGDLVAVLTADIELLEVFYAHTISPICIAVLVSGIMTVLIGSIRLSLGVIALAAYMIVGIVIPVYTAKCSRRHGEASRQKFSELDAFMLDSLRGVRESIQYGNGENQLKQIYAHADTLAQAEKRLKSAAGTSTAITGGVVMLLNTAMLLACARLCGAGVISFAQALIAQIALMSSFGPVLALADLGAGLQNTCAAANRVLDILDETPEVQEVEKGLCPDFTGMKTKELSFSYAGEPVLKNVNAEIGKGEIVGITGRSGSGKSTLLKLLMRFWNAGSGSVEFSGQEIGCVQTDHLRRMQSYVTQDTMLFHDSILKNLMIAAPNATREQVEEACRKASIHDFIVSLPKGYDTPVGELGETLSGGERQRLGLARAFLHDAPMILLDEPTSNLDALNEAVILKSLQECARGKTIVLVSHRESTMRIADKIYSVENGRVS